jgi:YjgF/chorismate_mutase-like, putative endoribonuclease
MRIEHRLAELGFALPEPMRLPSGLALPFPWVRLWPGRAFVSGHGPLQPDGSLIATLGKVGAEVSEEQAYVAARATALAVLASLQRALGDLDRVTGWLRVFGMINTAPGFTRTPAVINGFSDLILDLWGPEAGSHARSAIGVAELPFGIPVEIEAEVAVDLFAGAVDGHVPAGDVSVPARADVLRDPHAGSGGQHRPHLREHRRVGQQRLPDRQPHRAKRVGVVRIVGQQGERFGQRLALFPVAEHPLQQPSPHPHRRVRGIVTHLREHRSAVRAHRGRHIRPRLSDHDRHFPGHTRLPPAQPDTPVSPSWPKVRATPGRPGRLRPGIVLRSDRWPADVIRAQDDGRQS